MATKVKTKHKSGVWVENVKTIVYAGIIALIVVRILWLAAFGDRR